MEECEKLGGVAEIEPDSKVYKVFEEADNVRLKLGLLEINPICALCALSRPEVGFSADQLKSFPIREKDIWDCFIGDGGNKKTNANVNIPVSSFDGASDAPASKANLEKYCVCKTDEARDGKLHSIVSRDNEIRQMMENFRANPLKEMAGEKVVCYKDFKAMKQTDAEGNVTKLDMPCTSNVLQYFTAAGDKISVRPSGTEPKIKFYIEVRGIPMEAYADYDNANRLADEKIEAFKKDLCI